MSTKLATSNASDRAETSGMTPLKELCHFLTPSLEELLEIGRKIKSSNLKHWVRIIEYVLTLETIQRAIFDFNDEKSLKAAMVEIPVDAKPAQKERISQLLGKIRYILDSKRSSFFKKGMSKDPQLMFQSEVYNLLDALTLLFIQERESLLNFHGEKARLFETFNVFVGDFGQPISEIATANVLKKIPVVVPIEEDEFAEA